MERLSEQVDWNHLDRKYLFYALRVIQATLHNNDCVGRIQRQVDNLRGRDYDGKKVGYPYIYNELDIGSELHDAYIYACDEIGTLIAMLEWLQEILQDDIQPEVDVQAAVRSKHNDVIYKLNKVGLEWSDCWHDELSKWGMH